jgi:hypothetical protein
VKVFLVGANAVGQLPRGEASRPIESYKYARLVAKISHEQAHRSGHVADHLAGQFFDPGHVDHFAHLRSPPTGTSDPASRSAGKLCARR